MRDLICGVNYLEAEVQYGSTGVNYASASSSIL